MRRPNTFVRVAAVASSVLLVGGLIGYRAGAFGRAASETPTSPVESDDDRTMLPGSKSFRAIGEAVKPNPPQTEAPPEKPLTVLPGSKSIAISPVVPAPNPPPNAPPMK